MWWWRPVFRLDERIDRVGWVDRVDRVDRANRAEVIGQRERFHEFVDEVAREHESEVPAEAVAVAVVVVPATNTTSHQQNYKTTHCSRHGGGLARRAVGSGAPRRGAAVMDP